MKRLTVLGAALAAAIAGPGWASEPTQASEPEAYRHDGAPAAGHASKRQPCPPGGYYGSGSEPPPGSQGIYGSLLQLRSKGSSLDANGDLWVCYSTQSASTDDAARLPVPRHAELIVRGDVGYPETGTPGVDTEHDLFYAAGLSGDCRTPFGFTRQFHYDSNDWFHVGSRRVNMRAFERALAEGDLFTAVYSDRRSERTVWSFYSHEV